MGKNSRGSYSHIETDLPAITISRLAYPHNKKPRGILAPLGLYKLQL
ncbi:hypothetical protein Dxin01_03539 [Deinococcus xinjiangensis]|uniref:Uncharacterized protein n=1 Tax=Deinococcus xinjiangensis TaxID=457454 RepID=A0ABP9VEW8_9DEIO